MRKPSALVRRGLLGVFILLLIIAAAAVGGTAVRRKMALAA